MKICVSTANLGTIDPGAILHTQQVMPDTWHADYFSYNNDNFAPRSGALHPRLQAKIPKMLAHEMHPGYDYYVWIDGSIALRDKSALFWLISQCEGFDIALFPHPYRCNIREEIEYCFAEMIAGNTYLNERYQNEPLLEQANLYLSDPNFVDNNLFAGGVFAYSTSILRTSHNMMSDWFYHCARHSVQDQISLPFLFYKHGINYNMICENIFANPYFSFVGHK